MQITFAKPFKVITINLQQIYVHWQFYSQHVYLQLTSSLSKMTFLELEAALQVPKAQKALTTKT